MKILSLLILSLLLCPLALAQEYPKAEIYAGYSSVRTDDETVDLMGLSPGLSGTGLRRGPTLTDGTSRSVAIRPNGLASSRISAALTAQSNTAHPASD